MTTPKWSLLSYLGRGPQQASPWARIIVNTDRMWDLARFP